MSDLLTRSSDVHSESGGSPSPQRVRPTDWRPAFVVAALIGVLAWWSIGAIPWQGVAIIVGSAVIAFVVWTTYGYTPVESKSVIATYLLAVAFQILHLAEEWTGDFPHEFEVLVGATRPWSLDTFMWAFVFVFGSLWVAAGAGALYRLRIANYFIWFYALGAGLINAIAHFVFPVVKGGYFPGLYTAPGHLIFSVMLLVLLVREHRELQARVGHVR